MPPHYISDRGYTILKKDLTEEQIIDIRNELTVKPFIMQEYSFNVTSFPVYLESDRKFYLPKFYAIKKFHDKQYIDKTSQGDDIKLDFNGNLRPEQVGVVDMYIDVANKKGGGIISLGCGSGKTTIALNIVSRLGKKALVVVHKDFLLVQWKERIAQFLPNASVGIIKQSKVDIINRDIVLASLQSLALREYNDNMLDSFGMVIIDECHHVSSEVFSRALPKISRKYMLGLSATPNRKDGLTKVFEWYLGDIIIERKRELDDTILVRMVYFHSNNTNYCEEKLNFQMKLNMAGMINNVCDYNKRTECITEYVKELVKDGRNILILTDRLNHIEYIKTYIEHNGICTVGKYIGGMKEKQLKASESAQLILATYSMAAEGMDLPNLDSLILASPRTDIEQSVGRILRKKMEDRLKSPIIIDIVDKFSLFKRQGEKRKIFYKKSKYKIVMDNYYSEGFENKKNKDIDINYKGKEDINEDNNEKFSSESIKNLFNKCLINFEDEE
jgi:superfamily II DNA or RNA helicase